MGRARRVAACARTDGTRRLSAKLKEHPRGGEARCQCRSRNPSFARPSVSDTTPPSSNSTLCTLSSTTIRRSVSEVRNGMTSSYVRGPTEGRRGAAARAREHSWEPRAPSLLAQRDAS